MNRLREERGAELVEFAFILPVLLFVVVGIIDFGFMFRNYEILTNAAREGARLGALAEYDIPDVRARVKQYAASAGLDQALVVPEPVEVDIPMGITGQTAKAIKVDVSYAHEFTFLGPIATLFGGQFGSVTLRASSTMRKESQAVAGAGGN